MKSSVVVLSLLALVVVACEERPARDPSGTSTSTTSARSSGYESGSSARGYSNTPAQRGTQNPNVVSGDSTLTTGSSNEAATGSRGIEHQSPDSSNGGATAGSGAVTDSNANRAIDRDPSTDAKNVDTTKNVDNTKKNERDRHGTLTPGDQGNSGAETKISADIRKQLVVSKTLSMTAKNAKIITTGSKVTLRGVVKSDQEKAEIEGVAKATNGVTDVDNQLEVKK